jgi:hypothetical protein
MQAAADRESESVAGETGRTERSRKFRSKFQVRKDEERKASPDHGQCTVAVQAFRRAERGRTERAHKATTSVQGFRTLQETERSHPGGDALSGSRRKSSNRRAAAGNGGRSWFRTPRRRNGSVAEDGMRTGSIRESGPDLPRENVPETVQTPGVLWKSQARHCPAPTMQAAGRSESSDPQLIEAAAETTQLQSEFRVVRSGTRYRGAVVYGPVAERRADCERCSRPLTVCRCFVRVPRLP